MNQQGLLPAQITQFSTPGSKGNNTKNTSKNTSKNTAKNTSKNTAKNNAAKNTAKNAAKNTKNTSSKSNKSSAINDILNTIDDKIEVNKKNLVIWILLLLANVFILWHYISTPIRYSSDKVEEVVSYNRLYYYLHLGLLILLFLYGNSVKSRFSPLYKDTTLLLGVLIIVLVLSIFVLNIASRKPLEEDGLYRTEPKYLYKKKGQIIILVLLLLSIIGIIGYDVYKRRKNPLGLLPYNKLNNLYGIGMLLSVFIVLYLLINGSRYSVLYYNLPKMWK